jgi:hypothetical protein
MPIQIAHPCQTQTSRKINKAAPPSTTSPATMGMKHPDWSFSLNVRLMKLRNTETTSA